MPNARPAIAPAGRPNNRCLCCATDVPQTAAHAHSAGARPSPNCSPYRNEYAAWYEALPDSLHDTATAEAMQAIIELDLEMLADITPPRGFGRD